MIYIFVYAGLVIVGYLVGLLVHKHPKVDGILGIDKRDPNKDYYDFVFLTPTDDIPKKKYMTIEVKVK